MKYCKKCVLRTSYLLAVVGAFAVAAIPSAHADTFGSGTNTFEIEFVTVGDPGNLSDTTGDPSSAGAVPYIYRIGKYEISESMIDAANAISEDAGDALGITHDGRGPNKPATRVSWFEAAQFVNWLNTSKGSTPAYKFDANGDFQLWEAGDAGYNPDNLFRNSQSRYFFSTMDGVNQNGAPVSNLDGATITLTQGELRISESLTIDASALPNSITIDASGNDPTPNSTPFDGDNTNDGDGSSVFFLDFSTQSDLQATFTGLTITGGDTDRGGGINLYRWAGGWEVPVKLSIIDTVIKNNHALDVGGGVNAYGWETGPTPLGVNIIGSTIEDNTAGGDGGTSEDAGGGIYVMMTGWPVGNNETVFNLVDSTVANNETINGDGGGIWVGAEGQGTFNAINSTISGNRVTNGRGGGLWVHDFTNFNMFTNLSHVTITENVALNVDLGGGGELFSGTNPKLITTLNNTSGSNSIHADYSFSEAFEKGIHEFQTVPVGGADTIEVVFSELIVDLDASDLWLYGRHTGTTYTSDWNIVDFAFDDQTFTARWRFDDPADGDSLANPFPADKLVIGFNVVSFIQDATGNRLDGDWDYPFSLTDPPDSFPSGDGTEGGAFFFTFVIMPGDNDLTNTVSGSGFLWWQRHFDPNGTDNTFTDGDFDGDGDGDDLALWQASFG